jgi:hypothetical protein
MVSRATGCAVLAIDDSDGHITYDQLMSIGKSRAYKMRRDFEESLRQTAVESQEEFLQRILQYDDHQDSPTFDGGFNGVIRMYREHLSVTGQSSVGDSVASVGVARQDESSDDDDSTQQSSVCDSDDSKGLTWYDANRDDDDSWPGARAHYIDNPGNDEELASRFCKALVRKCTFQQGDFDSYFEWKVLGEEAGICFNAVPSRVQFLAGSLSS